MDDFCIVVHAGAGYHSRHKEAEYSRLCKDACLKASHLIQGLSSDLSAINAACSAVTILEDSCMSNAGYGSNLTVNGKVECDAGVMCGSRLRFSAVGSLSNIKNPVQVAEHLLLSQIEHPITQLGRVFPSILVGEGALSYAVNSVGLSKVNNSEMISQNALCSWNKYKGWLETSDVNKITSFSEDLDDTQTTKSPVSKKPRVMLPLDTVGAVCINSSGFVASAVSSGGVAMKCPGRLGQACVYGAGSWAENVYSETGESNGGVGVVTSGTGEQLIRTQLAQRCAERLLDNSLPVPIAIRETLSSDFLTSRYLKDEPAQRFAGIIGCLWQVNSNNKRLTQTFSHSTVEIFLGHTTQSMSIAYFVGGKSMRSPKAFVSRKAADKAFVVEAYSFRLSST